MATMLAPVDAREVLRCDACHLVQFRAHNNECRRCHKTLDPDEVALGPILVPKRADSRSAPAPTDQARGGEGLQVAKAIRSLRQRAGLSQRQLALRMQVPRTYISKIENEKALPTLSSMARLAEALQVTIPDLLRGGELTLRERAREITADPLMAQLLPDLVKLDSMQRSTLLGELRTMALRSRRSA